MAAQRPLKPFVPVRVRAPQLFKALAKSLQMTEVSVRGLCEHVFPDALDAAVL